MEERPPKRASDAGPPLLRPPKPLGSGESPLYPAQRNAVIGVSVMVVLYAATCLWLGWDGPAGAVEVGLIFGFAGLFSMLFLTTVWLGASDRTPTGFQVGRAAFLAPRWRRAQRGWAARVARFVSRRIPWQLREPLFRLPVLLPIVWAAATFASVPHQVQGEIHGQLEPTLIALLTAVIAINGFLAVRGQRTIDFLGALTTVLVLIAGAVISLIQIADNGKGQVQWVAAAVVFGLVAIIETGIRGANSPDASQPTPPQPRPQQQEVPSLREPGVRPPQAGTGTTLPPLRVSNLLPAVGAIVALVLLVLLLWLLVRLVSWGTTHEAQIFNSAALLCGLASVGFAITWLTTKEPKWILPTVVGAVLTTALGLGGGWLQKHVEGTDCLAFDAQFGQLVGDQTQATALKLSKTDQRRPACLPALKGLSWHAAQPECLAFDAQFAELVRNESLAFARRGLEADGRRSACSSTLGRINNAPPVTDCVTFLAQLDELVDDEPIKVAAVAIEHDSRTQVCHPRLGLLARR
jgi:hypothetical protein